MGKRVLIISGNVTSKQDCFQKLKAIFEAAGTAVSEFTDVCGEPTDITVNAALKAYEDNGCDCLAAIGGGSALDTMKAVAVLAACGGSISDYMGRQITAELPPMAAVPTTAGTGSEATRFTVITDSKTDVKMLLGGASLIPDIAVVDPALTVSAPKGITAATGLDALTHAIESYTSRKAQPLTDTVAMSAVKRIFANLPEAYRDGNNLKARSEMSIAALEAGIAINNASVTIVHGMSRPIGAYFHVPHGISNAMLLEKALSFALDGAYERFAELSRAVGAADKSDSDKTAAEKFIAAVKKLCDVCEIPTLAEYGIDKERFFEVIDKMSEDAVASGSPANTIKPVTKEDVAEIYKRLWE
jgi:alcohol dehydrogenase class IV